jgi:DNA-binding response OmpR family regulator
MKILAVDDDLFILELLPMIAARAGFKDVSTAASGDIALKKLINDDVVYDCLLFDISMPDMDGIELCARVRSIAAYAKTPIIMVTAMADKIYVDRAFAAGATDYVNKPFEVVELGARLGMAEELIATRNLALAALKDAQDTEGNVLLMSAPLTEEVQIDGVAAVIEYVALKNYLSQLSSCGVACSQVIAFRISQVEAIYARASKDEFLRALTETARAINQATESFSPMMAYIGNGMFLMVLEKPVLENSKELVAEVQSKLDAEAITYDNGDPIKIVILASNPIRPSTSKLQRVRKTFDRAILRAEKLELRR